MSPVSFKPILAVAFLMVICPLKLTLCKSIIDDEFEIEPLDEAVESMPSRVENSNQGQRSLKRLGDDEFEIEEPLNEAIESKAAARVENFNQWQRSSKRLGDEFEIEEPLNEAVESKAARVENFNQGQRHSKRVTEPSQNILNQCFSGNLEETVKALGLLDLPGVRMVRVEGELYQKLLKSQKLVELKSVNVSAPNVSSEKSVSKRSSIDMCEEQFGYTYVLAHASGHLAYQVDTVVCQGNLCQSPYLNSLVGDFGDCVLKEQRMVVYVIDSYGNFAPQTIDIGCACECMAYF